MTDLKGNIRASVAISKARSHCRLVKLQRNVLLVMSRWDFCRKFIACIAATNWCLSVDVVYQQHPCKQSMLVILRSLSLVKKFQHQQTFAGLDRPEYIVLS